MPPILYQGNPQDKLLLAAESATRSITESATKSESESVSMSTFSAAGHPPFTFYPVALLL